MSTTNFFLSSGAGWDRLHAGLLAGHVDAFADWLADQGYARKTGRRKLRLVGQFSRWLEDQGLDLPALDEVQLERFRSFRSRLGKYTANVMSDGRELLAWLRETGRLAPIGAEPSYDDPVGDTVDRYERFLFGERGASLNTVQAYLSTVRAFVGDCFESRPADLGSLGLRDINGFILHSCHSHSPATTRVHVAALRSFTRYLYRSEIMATDIADGIAGVRTWRLSSLPKGLEPDQVEAVLASCDRSTVTGRRDYGVLLLLALLGLRACEVVRLTLDDIDWDNAEIAVVGKGSRHDVLPLPHEVGEALVAYLQAGRPSCATRRLFVGRYAPVHGFQSSAAVGHIVRRALAQAGIERPGRGAAHLLRHSLATRMLRNGASLEEIGQILRHQSPDSTRIYAKVDLDALRPLAPAWPGGMTSLWTLCEDYLAFRRSLGAKLVMTHGLLLQFITFLAQREAPFITAALALQWASKPEGVQQEWRARRLSEVRQFARYVHALDPRHEVPPQRLLPYRRQRPQPYIYSDGEIEDLIGAARDLSGRLRPRTCSTMLGLLAVTGMRSGEVVGLDRDDVDLRQGILTIRESKFGKSRLNLCHDTTVQALGEYAAWRDEHCPRPHSPAFFLNERAKRIDKTNFRMTFKTLTHQTGLRHPAASRGPRLHDLRHTFSVRTLIRWYRDGVDIDCHLPRLSTWLGHSCIADSYWYLTAVPELMALAARRLDERQGRHNS